MLFRILFFLSVVLLIDFYFFQSVKVVISNLTAGQKNLVHYSYWGFTLFTILFFVLFVFVPVVELPKFFKIYTVSIIVIIMASKLVGNIFLLVDDLIRGFKWLFSFISHASLPSESGKADPISRSKFLSFVAIGAGMIPFFSMIYGMAVTAFDYKVRKIKIHLPNLPAAFEGLRIVQISDIHSGSIASERPLRKAVKMVNEQKGDMVFFTGDLVNYKAEEVEPFALELKKISAPMGVFSVLGNHDYGDYIPWDSAEAKTANFARLIELHAEMGWQLLRNENRIIEKNGEKIALLGSENWGAALRFHKMGDLDKTNAGTNGIPVKLLLSHDPSVWDAKVRTEHPDIDVTFSGHTHGFQFGIEIPGFKWSPVQYVYKQWAGLYQEGKQYIHVNRGLGCLGYLGRVGIHPEITVVELTSHPV